MAVNIYVSDVMFNMENYDNDKKIIKDNALMIITMLNSVGAKDIPTVQELVDDFNSRL